MWCGTIDHVLMIIILAVLRMQSSCESMDIPDFQSLSLYCTIYKIMHKYYIESNYPRNWSIKIFHLIFVGELSVGC